MSRAFSLHQVRDVLSYRIIGLKGCASELDTDTDNISKYVQGVGKVAATVHEQDVCVGALQEWKRTLQAVLC